MKRGMLLSPLFAAVLFLSVGGSQAAPPAGQPEQNQVVNITDDGSVIVPVQYRRRSYYRPYSRPYYNYGPYPYGPSYYTPYGQIRPYYAQPVYPYSPYQYYYAPRGGSVYFQFGY